MNQEQKNKYVRLKKQCAEKGKYKQLEKNQLFQDLQNCLKDYEKLTCEETDIIYNRICQKISRYPSGNINWSEFHGTCSRISLHDIKKIGDLKRKYYIIWDNSVMPGILCSVESISKCIEKILSISFDTWFVSMDEREIIEFYHEGIITYGKIE